VVEEKSQREKLKHQYEETKVMGWILNAMEAVKSGRMEHGMKQYQGLQDTKW